MDASSSASASWAGNRSGKLKILPPGPVWGRKKETIKPVVDTRTKSCIPFGSEYFGYHDFGPGCKAYSGCSFHVPGGYPNTQRGKVTHFVQHKPFPLPDFGPH